MLQALVEAISHVIFRKSSQVESDFLGSWPIAKEMRSKMENNSSHAT
jgi:hypothetical protein